MPATAISRSDLPAPAGAENKSPLLLSVLFYLLGEYARRPCPQVGLALAEHLEAYADRFGGSELSVRQMGLRAARSLRLTVSPPAWFG
mgnify:CR=1 FL=1